MGKKLKQNTATVIPADELGPEITVTLNDPFGLMPESKAEADLEAVVATLEATEVQEPEAVTEEVAEGPAEDADFVELMDSATDSELESMLDETRTAIRHREAFEDDKNPDNANIHRTLKKVRSSLDRSWAAKVMVAAKQNPSFINRMLMDGSCYNVYAIGKYGDLVDALAGSGMRNAINIAITRSLFAFSKAGIAFTGEMAKAAASDKIKVADHLKKHLIRHTVSASTAPTQASSTMQALETLGIVAVEGSRKHPTYRLLSTPQRYRLEKVVEAMAA
jgi:hypothetical protein